LLLLLVFYNLAFANYLLKLFLVIHNLSIISIFYTLPLISFLGLLLSRSFLFIIY